MPENDWRIPLTFGYKGAMKIIQSVIHGCNYQNTCNYESIHVRKQIFDHFSRFRLSTQLLGRCPALTLLLQLITPSRESGTADHVLSSDDLFSLPCFSLFLVFLSCFSFFLVFLSFLFFSLSSLYSSLNYELKNKTAQEFRSEVHKAREY